MADMDLKEFEHKIVLRTLKSADLDAVMRMQLQCFPGMRPWSREQFESQLRIFPEGQLGVDYEGRLVASSSSLIVDFSQHSEWHNWKQISDDGYIRNHDLEGDTLYGIEIMVDPELRGLRLSRRLYDARKQIARERNLARIIIGGRIPGYGRHAAEMCAREYVEKVMNKTLVDPVLTTQTANGFVLKALIPDYFPADSDSRGFATFLEWTNLDHVPRSKTLMRRIAPVRICVVQYQMRSVESFEEFARQCEYFVDVAADYKCDFILFPELITTQLLSIVKAPRPGLAVRRLSDYTDSYLERFSQLAIGYNINVIGGSHFLVENDKLYNVAFLFRRDGTLERQYKLHVTPNEQRWWGVSTGDRLEVFNTDCGRIAILVCYDIEFPELARIAADKGARILFVPFNTDERYAYLRVRYCAQARCIENHVYAAVAGCVGNLPFVDNADIHYAQSGIFAPSDIPFDRDGIMALCTPNIETVIVDDLDLELLWRHRRQGTVRNWMDRRQEIYALRYRDGDVIRTVGVHGDSRDTDGKL
ncbi:MAG: carbon-nitrogen hydrolase family protein [Vicinamibacteria bacterium]|nr:carbon-nitrogen hydrolase family protein [Vicinamibacteria bacterium]